MAAEENRDTTLEMTAEIPAAEEGDSPLSESSRRGSARTLYRNLQERRFLLFSGTSMKNARLCKKSRVAIVFRGRICYNNTRVREAC